MAQELPILPQHTSHSRSFRENKYVYPVLSRRSKGISIGINLNPDKVCNFDCIYCQVDRRVPGGDKHVDLDLLIDELEFTLDSVLGGGLFEDPEFRDVPQSLRRLNDFAFSGDGEPTSEPNFAEVVRRVGGLKRQRSLDNVKIVLITNATLFDRPMVWQGVERMMACNGEIWGKLDAGTDSYYHLVDRTNIPFSRVLENLLRAARAYPLVIQSLFMRVNGEGPGESEISAYIDRLKHILNEGGRLSLIQLYTVARRPAEDYVTHLEPAQLDDVALRVRAALPIPVETYYGGT